MEDHLKSITHLDIKPLDILKHENTETKEVTYYIYEFPYLYKYDSNGNLGEGHERKDWRSVIKIDPGAKLVDSYTCKWSIVGTKDEIYPTIFRKDVPKC